MNIAKPHSTVRAAKSLAIARLAISIVFFVPGFGMGLWAVHIPVVAERIGIDPAIIGLALLSAAIGAVVTMPIAGVLMGRFGSRLPSIFFALAFIFFLPLPMLAPNAALLIVSLFFFGAAMGGVDVSMNTQASELEAARGKPTMSSFHGFFSVGTLVGALAGGLIIAVGWGDGSGALLSAFLLLLLAGYGVANLWPSERVVHQGPRFVLPPPAVLGLGAITFLVFAAEGGVTDWSALYLTTVRSAEPATAALAVAAFSVAMTIFRLSGDWLVAKLGPYWTILGGGILILIGIGMALMSPWIPLSIAGFAIAGIGMANVVPVAFSTAARAPGLPPGIGIASVTTMGYAGFLIFPPILGFVGRGFGLTASIAIIAAMGLGIMALLPSLRADQPR